MDPDPSTKNLREWIGLLFCLFCVLDIVGVQYGMALTHRAVLQPDYDTGRIAPMLSGARGDWHQIYVTEREVTILRSVLAAAAAALLASLGLIVGHGMRLVRQERRLAALLQRKR